MVPVRYRPDPLDAPVHIAGPEGPWDEVGDRLDDVGRAVICTTWGQWLAAVLLDPALRPLLGSDWPRYRQTEPAAGRMRFAVSRFVVRHAAAAALNVPVDGLELGYEPGGQPLVRGAGEDLEVSLAHTGELIVVGVSRTGPIGVDVQAADRDVSCDGPAGPLCTVAEGAALAALPESERRARLLWLWTLKEAHARALGHGHGLRRGSSTVGFGHDDRGRVVLAGAVQEGGRPGTGRSPPISSRSATWSAPRTGAGASCRRRPGRRRSTPVREALQSRSRKGGPGRWTTYAFCDR